jgi:aryl-alcohol dehydrogenase-like predicted oxidoreductase
VTVLDAKDIRRSMPRFSPANHAANLTLLGRFAALARAAGCSQAQLALSWVLSRGDHVLAIPGTTQTEHLEENVAAGSVRLDADLAARLDRLINGHTIAGARYNAATQAEIDTEEFAPAL